MKLGDVHFKYMLRSVGVISSVLFLARIGHAATQTKDHSHAIHEAAARSKPVEHVRRPAHHTIVHRVAVHHSVEHHVEHRSPVRHVAAHHVIRRREAHERVVHVEHVAGRRIEHHTARRYEHLHHLVRRVGYRWCVPYAREVSHIDLKGDAFLWWAEAAGRYARGIRPEEGAVLNFRPTHRMPLGHVAVVSKVINSREVLVDQANWIPDTVTRNVPVIDVSANNDWSKVRVALGDGKFGMDYPTYGFIYRQAPTNVIYANSGGTEVAEAPVVHTIRLTAPNRSLR